VSLKHFSAGGAGVAAVAADRIPHLWLAGGVVASALLVGLTLAQLAPVRTGFLRVARRLRHHGSA
jgi:hypothetical protein